MIIPCIMCKEDIDVWTITEEDHKKSGKKIEDYDFISRGM